MALNDLEGLHSQYKTNAGLAYLSECSIFRNKDLHHDLGELSWFEFNLFGITGKKYSPVELEILNFIWVSTSYADIRIWPNRIAALASSARTTPILSMVGGIASCDAELFVAKPLVSCLSMYLSIGKKLENNSSSLNEIIEEKLIHKKTIFGFGRPITSTDERVPHLITFLHKRNMDNGKYFKMAFKIEAILKEKKQIQMNIAALYAAICADFGFNEVEMNLFVSLLVYAGMPPCYLDTLEKPAGTLLPIKANDIKYTGIKPRAWTSTK
jgi:citrate synthase